MRSTLVALVLLVACGGPTPPNGNTLPSKKMSATEHHEAAMRHEREADAHDREAAARAEAGISLDQQCFDEAVPSVSETGGEPLEIMRPCWTSLDNPAAHERQRADEHRHKAAQHRASAKALRTAEAKYCAGLGAAELSQSPFAHRRDILSVTELTDGVRIEFRKVPGLSAAWMERSLECHYARAAALGFSEKFMPYCPITLPDIAFSVTETDGIVAVTIHSERSEMAAASLGRARDLRREVVEDVPSP